MGKLEEMGETTDKEIEKMKKKQELKQELDKAKDQGAQDKEREIKSM